MKKLAILYEHPQWHQPLFNALQKAEVDFTKIDLTQGSFDTESLPKADIYYNMVSPSAYLRSNMHAIPYALSLCTFLENEGKIVLNGTSSMKIEMSKSAQLALLKKLNIAYPKSIIFNNTEALDNLSLEYPVILKPEQGGSGARMYLLNSKEEILDTFKSIANLWQPDNLMLLQEKLIYDEEKGSLRIDYVNGKMIYAMRVVSNGNFNLCPSVICNPDDGNGVCAIPIISKTPPKFYAETNVNPTYIEMGKSILKEANHFSGSIELVECNDGRVIVYDINSNSNLRESISLEFGHNPFDFVVKDLISLLR